MRVCQLRAGLSKADGISGVTLGNPKSWLGTAYHFVLEQISSFDPQADACIEVKPRHLLGGQDYRRYVFRVLDRSEVPRVWQRDQSGIPEACQCSLAFSRARPVFVPVDQRDWRSYGGVSLSRI